MLKKVIKILALSKMPGPDCIPMVVLKTCKPELSYILAECFNKGLKSFSPDCWKVSSEIPVFKNVWERSAGINYHPVSLLPVPSKDLNNRIE